jgi:hypothetical protein
MASLFIFSTYVYCCLVKNRKCAPLVRDKPSLCFSGCGLRYHFYAGVADYMLENFETDDIDILCVSGGVYAATCLALQRKTSDWSRRDWTKCYDYWTNRRLYLFLDTTDFQRQLWRDYLPYDAYKRCTNKLFIVISRVGLYGLYEELISEYDSNEELIDAICGTIHIPGIFLNIPNVKGRYAFDGCYTNLTPKTQSPWSTLVVKLFGRGNIDYGNRLPFSKLLSIVAPEDVELYMNEGYDAAKRNHHKFVERGFIS